MKQDLTVEYKAPWTVRTREATCTMCLDRIPHGAEMFPFVIRDALDDAYALLNNVGSQETLLPQFCCVTCRKQPPMSLPLRKMIRHVEWRCEALLKSGRRCRQTSYVYHDTGLDEDRCPKHRSMERATL